MTNHKFYKDDINNQISYSDNAFLECENKLAKITKTLEIYRGCRDSFPKIVAEKNDNK